MPKLRAIRKTAWMSHRDSRNRFVSTEDFINDVELRELLNTLTVDDDDGDSIIQDTISTESDFDVIGNSVLDAEIDNNM